MKPSPPLPPLAQIQIVSPASSVHVVSVVTSPKLVHDGDEADTGFIDDAETKPVVTSTQTKTIRPTTANVIR